MERQNYHTSITAPVAAKDAYAGIADVSAWWAKNFEGSALKLGDKFTVRFGDTWVDFAITEAIPGKKSVWTVTDCHLPWLEDKKEWNGTYVVWDLEPHGSATQINMTHVGLTPEVPCYQDCKKGWTGHIQGSLLNLLSGGKGSPE